MRYTHAARTTAMETARELAAPQVATLEAMRAHNAALEQFTVTAEVPEALGNLKLTPVAAMMTSVKSEKKETKKRESQRAEDARIAREALES